MDVAAAKGRVLIVDDQFLIVEFLRIWVETYGFEVCETAASASEAVEKAVSLKPDIVLMDVQLEGGGDGITAAADISAAIDARIVFVTGGTNATTLARIRERKPFATLIKPVDPEELGRVLERAMAGRSA